MSISFSSNYLIKTKSTKEAFDTSHRILKDVNPKDPNVRDNTCCTPFTYNSKKYGPVILFKENKTDLRLLTGQDVKDYELLLNAMPSLKVDRSLTQNQTVIDLTA
ncbi:MAG TPA: hypothetical protein DDW90_04675 [Cyanobacteria bacterium UBA9971]|nr:hypothetical protein [Cyanobacteria bacterium UBA9971]